MAHTVCANCGYKVTNLDAIFCEKCGTRLQSLDLSESVGQIRKARLALEYDLTERIVTFERDTGLRVSAVVLDRQLVDLSEKFRQDRLVVSKSRDVMNWAKVELLI